MLVIASLTGTALAIMIGAVGWGWSAGTLRDTPEDRMDHEFFRIIRRIDRSDRR